MTHRSPASLHRNFTAADRGAATAAPASPALPIKKQAAEV